MLTRDNRICDFVLGAPVLFEFLSLDWSIGCRVVSVLLHHRHKNDHMKIVIIVAKRITRSRTRRDAVRRSRRWLAWRPHSVLNDCSTGRPTNVALLYLHKQTCIVSEFLENYGNCIAAVSEAFYRTLCILGVQNYFCAKAEAPKAETNGKEARHRS